MALSVDTRKLIRAEVVPWEEGEFGVAWETADGQHGADRFASKAEAQAIVRDINQQRTAALDAAIVRPLRRG